MIGRILSLNPVLLGRLGRWSRRVGLGRRLALGLAIAAVLSVVATYAAMTGTPPFGPDPNTVLWLLTLDLALVLALGVVIARRLVTVWAERRRGLAGSKLHSRLVVVFGVVAVTPAIIVALFSGLFLNVSVEGWFSKQVRTALDDSQAIAEAYLHEHQQTIKADILAMAADLDRDAYMLALYPDRLNQIVETQAEIRSLAEAMVMDRNGNILARSQLAFSLQFDQPPPPEALARAQAGEVAILTSDNEDRVRALVRLDRFVPEAYLYVGRYVEPRVLNYIDRTQRAIAAYQRLEGQRSGLQVTGALIYVVVALLLLLAAVWVGLQLATRLARPIAALIGAAERVRAGDLSARVPHVAAGDELDSLSRAFNRMTSQLEAQRAELVEANLQLDLRRRFTETVLAGVSAGVLGVDATGRINLPNRSAATLLAIDLDKAVDADIRTLVPEMADLIEVAARRPDRMVEAQIKLVRDRTPRTLLVRVTAERSGDAIQGYVLTFDDVTELLQAQRTAAWADVARRIAHEIKNPLTPIQLSAERLKRKYLKEITSDPETFSTCTDTIVRQVGDIGRMVDEFSAFARMPAPIMKAEDLSAIARETVFLQRQAHPGIDFTLELPDQPVACRCDGRQLRQALTNLLQNAVDAIDGRAEPRPKGAVRVRIEQGEAGTVIEVADNGRGLPAEDRERLTEPYVTTRAKGTGLGLAIVKKIMEDHAGLLQLDDAPEGGARVRLVLPARAAEPPGVTAPRLATEAAGGA